MRVILADPAPTGKSRSAGAARSVVVPPVARQSSDVLRGLASHPCAMTHRVLIAGSGVAALEAVLALRHLAGGRFRIELLGPTHALEHRQASVATPFGLGAPPPLDLHAL